LSVRQPLPHQRARHLRRSAARIPVPFRIHAARKFRGRSCRCNFETLVLLPDQPILGPFTACGEQSSLLLDFWIILITFAGPTTVTAHTSQHVTAPEHTPTSAARSRIGAPPTFSTIWRLTGRTTRATMNHSGEVPLYRDLTSKAITC
jgi:hypothetical protein